MGYYDSGKFIVWMFIDTWIPYAVVDTYKEASTFKAFIEDHYAKHTTVIITVTI